MASYRLAIGHSDFVNPTRWKCDSSRDRREMTPGEERSRIAMCITRRAELKIESARTAAELTRWQSPIGLRTRDLPEECLKLLRKLGSMKIEEAEIVHELASLHAAQQ